MHIELFEFPTHVSFLNVIECDHHYVCEWHVTMKDECHEHVEYGLLTLLNFHLISASHVHATTHRSITKNWLHHLTSLFGEQTNPINRLSNRCYQIEMFYFRLRPHYGDSIISLQRLRYSAATLRRKEVNSTRWIDR